MSHRAGILYRRRLINSRVHGGNLRDDAIMVNTHYAKFSHPDPPGEYQAYLHHVFKEVYGLSVDDAYWLGELPTKMPILIIRVEC